MNIFCRWDNSWFRAVSVDEIENAVLTRLLIVEIFHAVGACAFQLMYEILSFYEVNEWMNEWSNMELLVILFLIKLYARKNIFNIGNIMAIQRNNLCKSQTLLLHLSFLVCKLFLDATKHSLRFLCWNSLYKNIPSQQILKDPHHQKERKYLVSFPCTPFRSKESWKQGNKNTLLIMYCQIKSWLRTLEGSELSKVFLKTWCSTRKFTIFKRDNVKLTRLRKSGQQNREPRLSS